MNGKHVKQMLLVGGGLLAVLVLAGVPLGAALPYALLLACPVMMMAMMFFMGGGGLGGHHGHVDGRGGPPEHEDSAPQVVDPAGQPVDKAAGRRPSAWPRPRGRG